MTKIIAVTACPSGVAHTYMAAEALESAAKAKGWEVKVETHVPRLAILLDASRHAGDGLRQSRPVAGGIL